MYKGLKKRKTYDEMINYLLHNQEIINYPNRSENKIKEWIDQKFADYNLYKEIRLQDELKQNKIEKLFVSRSTQKSKYPTKLYKQIRKQKIKKSGLIGIINTPRLLLNGLKHKMLKYLDHIQMQKLRDIITIDIKS